VTGERPGSRRTKLMAAGVILATLVAGTLAGVAVDRVLSRRAALAQAPHSVPCSGRPEGGLTVFETLDLSTEQRAQVDGILERRRRQMDVLWQEARPAMRALVDSTEAEIRVVLTPDQRAQFDRMREEGRKLGLKRQHDRQPPADSSTAGSPR
jgi:Spy/CpxP family protein refolding chaperone